MKLEGKVWKSGTSKYWIIEVPALSICTQGKSKKDAFFMIKDAIELCVYKKGFEIEVIPGEGSVFYIRANQPKYLFAFMLKQLRGAYGRTIKEVSVNLSVKSLNSYAQFEQGKYMPTLEKIDELLRAIDPELEPVLKVGKNSGSREAA